MSASASKSCTVTPPTLKSPAARVEAPASASRCPSMKRMTACLMPIPPRRLYHGPDLPLSPDLDGPYGTPPPKWHQSSGQTHYRVIAYHSYGVDSGIAEGDDFDPHTWFNREASGDTTWER